jgi:hypothetical protein
MARHVPHWRCLFGHRWGRVDPHAYELGRGYETAMASSACARCGFVGVWTGVPLIKLESLTDQTGDRGPR